MDFKELLVKIRAGASTYLLANYGYAGHAANVYLNLDTNMVSFSYSYASPGGIGMVNGSANVSLDELLNPDKFKQKIEQEREERAMLKKLQEKYGPFNGHNLGNTWPSVLPSNPIYIC